IESDLRRGLFGAAFGPGYYLGYVDRAGLGPPVTVRREPEPPAAAPEGSWGARLFLGAAAGLGAGAPGMGAAAWGGYREAQDASYEQPALAARDRYSFRRNLALGLSAAAAASTVAGVALWRLGFSSETSVAVTVPGAGLVLSGSFR